MSFRILILLLVAVCMSNAALIKPTSLSRTDINTAITSASDGDVILLPSGTSDWSAEPILQINKRIIINGMGTNRTILNRGTSSIAYLIAFFAFSAGTNSYGFSNFTVDGGSTSGSASPLLGIGSSVTSPATISNYNYRVHHVYFPQLGHRGFQTTGRSQGVVDHVRFNTTNNLSVQGATVQGTQRNFANALVSSTNTVQFGTFADFAFFEDCMFDFSFDNDGAFDCYDDAKLVFRFNNITNSNYISAHESAMNRTATVWEYYGNKMTITGAASAVVTIGGLRSGVGNVWSNQTVSLTSYNPTYLGPNLKFYRAAGTNVYTVTCPHADCPNRATLCNFPFNYSCDAPTGTNRADGNMNLVSGEYGYPARDQFGWSDPTTFSATNGVQTFYGVYLKANTYNGTNQPGNVFSWGSNTGLTGADGTPLAEPSGLIQAGRDFFNETLRPGWTMPGYPHYLVTSVTITPTSTAASQGGIVNFSSATLDGSSNTISTTKYYVMVSNPSGGSVVQSTGVYTAGTTNATDIVMAIDQNGNEAESQVVVTGASSIQGSFGTKLRRFF